MFIMGCHVEFLMFLMNLLAIDNLSLRIKFIKVMLRKWYALTDFNWPRRKITKQDT